MTSNCASTLVDNLAGESGESNVSPFIYDAAISGDLLVDPKSCPKMGC